MAGDCKGFENWGAESFFLAFLGIPSSSLSVYVPVLQAASPSAKVGQRAY